tara:strand:+ start:1373 stop:1690 length:318 start_codon:yes stop_codon:yes gene_type:complete
MPKAPENDSPTHSKLAFEDALSQLEELVRDMESDQMPLEELIKSYEQGTNLYRVCEKQLEEARGRIEIIRKKRDRENVLEPFNDESIEATDVTTPETSQDNGELF